MRLIFNQESARQLLRDPLLSGLLDYTDSNFTGNPKDRKSVIDEYFFLNRVVVS